jgi:hypothetical protein
MQLNSYADLNELIVSLIPYLVTSKTEYQRPKNMSAPSRARPKGPGSLQVGPLVTIILPNQGFDLFQQSTDFLTFQIFYFFFVRAKETDFHIMRGRYFHNTNDVKVTCTNSRN